MLRALVIAVVASAALYLVMVLASDGPAVFEALRGFDPVVLVGMLSLSLGCYAIRALRWGRLMAAVGHPVSARDAVYLHFSGQTMSVSPGRVGEVLKPWLAREVAGMPLTTGVALVFSERVGDLIAVCILALGGLSALGGGTLVLASALAAIVAATAVAGSERFHRLARSVVGRQSWARRHAISASEVSATVRTALSPRVLWWSVSSSVVAWGLEGVGFWLCVNELGFSGFGLFAAVSVYAVSTIVGAFTFLPGGIGLTEASMAGILIGAGMAASGASASTLLVRVVTLWWAVGVGWIALASRPRVFRRLMRGIDHDA